MGVGVRATIDFKNRLLPVLKVTIKLCNNIVKMWFVCVCVCRRNQNQQYLQKSEGFNNFMNFLILIYYFDILSVSHLLLGGYRESFKIYVFLY